MKKSMLFIFVCALLFYCKPNSLRAENKVCFSPGTCCEDTIIQMIKHAREEIMIAIEEITSIRIFQELIRAYSEGVRIFIITNRNKFLTESSLVYALNQQGILVRMSALIEERSRFAIFDNAQLITGSYNWTSQAPNLASSDCVMIDDQPSIMSYSKHFKTLWNAYTDEIYNFYIVKKYKKNKKFTKLQ